jgi:hypothetical protein
MEVNISSSARKGVAEAIDALQCDSATLSGLNPMTGLGYVWLPLGISNHELHLRRRISSRHQLSMPLQVSTYVLNAPGQTGMRQVKEAPDSRRLHSSHRKRHSTPSKPYIKRWSF